MYRLLCSAAKRGCSHKNNAGKFSLSSHLYRCSVPPFVAALKVLMVIEVPQISRSAVAIFFLFLVCYLSCSAFFLLEY